MRVGGCIGQFFLFVFSRRVFFIVARLDLLRCMLHSRPTE